MDSLKKLINGYADFRNDYLAKENESYLKRASKEQNPKIMIIACSDSRVNPAIVTYAGLGEIFMVNNVANIVPPYKMGVNTHHSTSAAIQYAVKFLNIEHIIIMGHSQCGGINALMHGLPETSEHHDDYCFIEPWMDIVVKAKEHVQKELSHLTPAEQLSACEKESSLISLDNLVTFPCVQKALDAGKLSIHAWYFDLKNGTLQEYSREHDRFDDILNIA